MADIAPKSLAKLWLAPMAVLLSSCGSDDDAVQSNLTVTKLSTPLVQQLAQRQSFTLNYELTVSGFEQLDADVHFYLVPKVTEGEQAEEVELASFHQLAAVDHPGLTTGVHQFSQQLTLPEELDGGVYDVLAIIDPENEHAEDDESDNSPNPDNSAHRNGGYPHAEILIAEIHQHNFTLDKVSLNSSSLTLSAPDEDQLNHHHADIVGFVDVSYQGSNTPVAHLTAQAFIAGQWRDIALWNAKTEQYQTEQILVFGNSNQGHFFGFDAEFSHEQLQLLHDDYQADGDNQLALRFSVHDYHELEGDDDADNQLEVAIPYYFFTSETSQPVNLLASASASAPALAPAVIKYESGYSKWYGDNSKFSIGVDLEGSVWLVPVINPSGRIVASGAVTSYIFNAENTLFSIDYNASAYVDGTNTGYDSSMTIFNNVVFEDENYALKFEKTWEKKWEEEKVLASANFMVGPIPVKVEAGVTGNIGFGLTVGYNAELYANGDLFSVDLGAFARGGVSAVVASAGVQAALTLINNVFALDSNVGFALVSNDSNKPHIYYGISLTDDIDVISGKFGLYAEIAGVKWCKKWGIPYPCGTKKSRYDLWLYQTPSLFKKSWTIYDKSGTVEL